MQHDPLERDPSQARRLQDLPQEQQPYGFAEFQRRAGRRPTWPGISPLLMFPRRFGPVAHVAAGVAAVGAAVALAAIGLYVRGDTAGQGHAPTVLAARDVPVPATARTRAAAQDPDATLGLQTEAMEGWLASLPPEPAVARVGARAAVVSLEDRIALLDDVISAERARRAPQARLSPIEQQRSQLLRSLVQVRYAERLATASN